VTFSKSVKLSKCQRPAQPEAGRDEEELTMAGKTFGEDLRNEMAGKGVMWGPAIAGAVLLGPVGFALGLATSVVLVASGSSSDSPPANGDRVEK